MKIWQMVTWEGLVTWKSNLIQVVETRKDKRRLKNNTSRSNKIEHVNYEINKKYDFG